MASQSSQVAASRRRLSQDILQTEWIGVHILNELRAISQTFQAQTSLFKILQHKCARRKLLE
jgi:hypothetical protein